MFAHIAAARRHLRCTCPCRGALFIMPWCDVEREEDARAQHSASSTTCALEPPPAEGFSQECHYDRLRWVLPEQNDSESL